MNSQKDLKYYISQAQKGNRKAQKFLYEKYKTYLFGIAKRYSDNNEEAEDILLEGFYRIFKDIKSYKGTGNIQAWMRMVMVNTALMHIRKYHKYKTNIAELNENIQIEDESLDLDRINRAENIIRLINELPYPQKLIFNLKGIEGYSFKEISEKLNINESTARSHYLRSRKKLQELLIKELK